MELPVLKRDKIRAKRTAIIFAVFFVLSAVLTAICYISLPRIHTLKSIGDSQASVENWCMTRILQGNNYAPSDEAAAIEAVTSEEIIAAAGGVTLDTVYFLTGKEEPENA